jgi:hypothetical protein
MTASAKRQFDQRKSGAQSLLLQTFKDETSAVSNAHHVIP